MKTTITTGMMANKNPNRIPMPIPTATSATEEELSSPPGSLGFSGAAVGVDNVSQTVDVGNTVPGP